MYGWWLCVGGGGGVFIGKQRKNVGRQVQHAVHSSLRMVFCKRGNIADKLKPKNINISFKNNSNVAIDLFVFIFYCDQTVIDVETGIVTKEFCRASCSTELRSKKNNMVLIT